MKFVLIVLLLKPHATVTGYAEFATMKKCTEAAQEVVERKPDVTWTACVERPAD